MTTVRVSPVAVLVMVTVAPGSTADCASLTTPSSVERGGLRPSRQWVSSKQDQRGECTESANRPGNHVNLRGCKKIRRNQAGIVARPVMGSLQKGCDAWDERCMSGELGVQELGVSTVTCELPTSHWTGSYLRTNVNFCTRRPVDASPT